MKKFISLFVVLAMLASIFCVSTSAAKVHVNCNFESKDAFVQQFMAGAFYIEDGILFGYSEARALQSNYELSPETYQWNEYDSSVTLAVADDDLVDEPRFVSIVYCNDGLYENGLAEGRVYMGFYYDIEARCFKLGNGLEYTTDNLELLVDPVEYEIDTDSGEEFFTLGMSVSANRIRCYYNDQLIYDFVDSANQWYIAQGAVSPFVYWQNGNFTQIKNITIADAGYIYPLQAGEATTAPQGDATTAPKATSETTTRKEVVDVTDDKGNAVTDADGNKVTEEIIITEPPVADTNTGAVQGGNSATTGDATYIVIAAMVATFGCALIVKRVSCK